MKLATGIISHLRDIHISITVIIHTRISHLSLPTDSSHEVAQNHFWVCSNSAWINGASGGSSGHFGWLQMTWTRGEMCFLAHRSARSSNCWTLGLKKSKFRDAFGA